MSELTPKRIVEELDKHIVGQFAAKKAVAIALRNRYRRKNVKGTMQTEITPKNILMIGPTGVGKTEIARRLAKLTHAPFVKVEASKFTEVGYVGRDVETIVRDLAEAAYKMVFDEVRISAENDTQTYVEERILDCLIKPPSTGESEQYTAAREKMRQKLHKGDFEEKEIDIEISQTPMIGGIEFVGPPEMEDLAENFRDMMKSNMGGRKQTKRMPVQEARRFLLDEAYDHLIDETAVKHEAFDRVEQDGIVFLDEIDKVVRGSERSGDVSREGVQRDLLPLVEGTTVKTKLGMIKTDHILFIASGAFHMAKPSDLIAELQGRFPIRVELQSLTVTDFVRILQDPDCSLVKQYAALMHTEGVSLKISKQAIERIAEIAYTVNERVENIGARRLHTIMEKLLEDIAFSVPDDGEKAYVIDKAFVDDTLSNVYTNEDLSRYIL